MNASCPMNMKRLKMCHTPLNQDVNLKIADLQAYLFIFSDFKLIKGV